METGKGLDGVGSNFRLVSSYHIELFFCRREATELLFGLDKPSHPYWVVTAITSIECQPYTNESYTEVSLKSQIKLT